MLLERKDDSCGCGAQREDSKNHKMKKIFFFGDSITAGQLVNPHENWVSLVSRDFTRSNQEVLFQSVATNGDTTDHALAKLQYQVIDQAPNFVFLQFGLNDANRWKSLDCSNRVPIEQFKKNVSVITERLITIAMAKVIILTSHSVTKNHDCAQALSLQQDLLEYNRVLRNIVIDYKENCSLIDFAKLSTSWKRDYLLDDGIHLSKHGHMYYANHISDSLAVILQSR